MDDERTTDRPQLCVPGTLCDQTFTNGTSERTNERTSDRTSGRGPLPVLALHVEVVAQDLDEELLRAKSVVQIPNFPNSQFPDSQRIRSLARVRVSDEWTK